MRTEREAALQDARAERAAALEELHAERNARRDYEYEARKKLYAECEPLLFQFVELGERAIWRIKDFAIFGREHRLAGEPDSLFDDEYYRVATTYRIFSPFVVFSLMQRVLTLVDLSLDARIKAYYELGRVLVGSFNDDYALAATVPSLPEYDQTADDDRQVIVYGDLTTAAEGLIVERAGEKPRCMTFGEFAAYSASRKKHESLDAVSAFITSIDPRKTPVAWRMLIVQYSVHRAFHRLSLVSSEAVQGKMSFDFVDEIPMDARADFDWRDSPDEATDEAVLVAPLAAARKYIEQRLSGYEL
jgi:hypothetical protein